MQYLLLFILFFTLLIGGMNTSANEPIVQSNTVEKIKSDICDLNTGEKITKSEKFVVEEENVEMKISELVSNPFESETKPLLQ